MAQSKLAELVISITAQGLGAVGAAIDALKKTLDSTTSAVVKLGTTFRQLTSGVAGGLTGAVGSLVGLASSVSQNTVEGDRLGQAFTLLSRVVNDMFAPYVRMLTQGIMELTRWWQDLDAGLKSGLAQWIAVGAAVGVLVATLPVLVAGLSGVLGIAAALLSPIGVLIGGLAALGAGFLGASAAGMSWSEILEKALAGMIRGWAVLQAIVQTTFTVLINTFQNIMKVGENLANGNNLLAGVRDLGEGVGEIWENAIRQMDGAEARAGALRRELAGLVGNLNGAFDRIRNAGRDQSGFRIRYDVQFEGLQSTFERLQKAFASNSGATIEQAQLGQLEQINANAQRIAAGIGRVADAVPAVR